MTSNRPYLIRAIHEWVLDNQLTPHLMVDANAEGVDVPKNYAKENGRGMMFGEDDGEPDPDDDSPPKPPPRPSLKVVK